ncbi:MAG TPA: hypothetical protein ENF51_01380 [Candidatus Aenigmarchaeota archaeon]|nr:hypothetical protein [Candidatus Aenigmarchaeota archaeon]
MEKPIFILFKRGEPPIGTTGDLDFSVLYSGFLSGLSEKLEGATRGKVEFIGYDIIGKEGRHIQISIHGDLCLAYIGRKKLNPHLLYDRLMAIKRRMERNEDIKRAMEKGDYSKVERWLKKERLLEPSEEVFFKTDKMDLGKLIEVNLGRKEIKVEKEELARLLSPKEEEVYEVYRAFFDSAKELVKEPSSVRILCKVKGYPGTYTVKLS